MIKRTKTRVCRKEEFRLHGNEEMCKLQNKILSITAEFVELLSFPSRLSFDGVEVGIFFPKATDSTTCSCPLNTYHVH